MLETVNITTGANDKLLLGMTSSICFTTGLRLSIFFVLKSKYDYITISQIQVKYNYSVL